MKLVLLLIFSVISFLSAEDTEIVIIYTSNTSGKLTWCRCPSDSLWGIDKRVDIIDSLRKHYPDVIVLDTGNLFTEREDLYFKNPYIIRFYNLINYTAITPGEQDFFRGDEYAVNMFLNKLKDGENIVLSANLLIRDTMKFKPNRIVTLKNGYKISIIGIASPESFKYISAEWKKSINIANPDSILKIIIPKVRKTCDLFILLSNSNSHKGKEFAERFPEIDIIIGGLNHEFAGEVKHWSKNNIKTVIAKSVQNGSYVGVLRIRVHDKRIIDFTNDIIPLTSKNKTTKEASQIIKEYEKEALDLTEFYAESIRKEKEELAKKPGVITLRFFFTSECHSCEKIKIDVLPKLRMEGINIIYYDVSVIKNYKIMIEKGIALKRKDLEVPVIIIGKSILSGDKECVKSNINREINLIKQEVDR